jgi:WD40 repeat protein
LLILVASVVPTRGAAPPIAAERPAHRAEVRAIWFAPDGRCFASVDRTGELRLWRTHDGRPIEPFAGPAPLRVLRFWFHPNARSCVAIGEDGQLHVRDLASGRPTRGLPAIPALAVRAWLDAADCPAKEFLLRDGPVVLSPDASRLAYLGEDRQVHLYDLHDGSVKRLAEKLSRDVNLVFAGDSRLLAIRVGPRRLSLWDVHQGKCVFEEALTGNCWTVPRFSPDGRTLAWSEDDRVPWRRTGTGPRVRLVDARARRHLGVLYVGGALNEEGMLFSDDGHLLAISHPQVVGVWDVRGCQLVRQVSHARVKAGFRPGSNGSLIVGLIAPVSGRHQVVDLRSGQALHAVSSTAPAIGSNWAVSCDERTLAVADREIVFREVLTGGEVGRLPGGHRGAVRVLVFSPGGAVLASSGSDGRILLRDWKRACGLAGEPAGPVDAQRLRGLWQTLAGTHAQDAYRAMGNLIAGPRQAETLLGRKLRQLAAEEGQTFRRLLADLDGDDFARRQSAQKRLEDLPREWTPFLRAVLDRKPSLEVRARLKRILAKSSDRGSSAGMRQRLRGVQVLEEIGTPEARRILETLARGEPATPLSQHARAALRRLARR